MKKSTDVVLAMAKILGHGCVSGIEEAPEILEALWVKMKAIEEEDSRLREEARTQGKVYPMGFSSWDLSPDKKVLSWTTGSGRMRIDASEMSVNFSFFSPSFRKAQMPYMAFIWREREYPEVSSEFFCQKKVLFAKDKFGDRRRLTAILYLAKVFGKKVIVDCIDDDDIRDECEKTLICE